MAQENRKMALVVDDVGTTAAVIAQILGNLGYGHVDAVRSVREAQDKLASANYSLILSDIHMQPADGLQFLLSLRHEASTASIPCLFVTNEVRALYVEVAQAAGANGYILKGNGTAQLQAKIEEALAIGRARSKRPIFCPPGRFIPVYRARGGNVPVEPLLAGAWAGEFSAP